MIMAVVAAVIAYLDRRATQKVESDVAAVHVLINSRVDKLLEQVGGLARAEGKLAGAAEEQARQKGK